MPPRYHYYQRGLAIFEKALGPDHPDVATCLNNLAGLYENQSNYQGSVTAYQAGAWNPRDDAQSRSSDLAQSLNNLAYLFTSGQLRCGVTAIQTALAEFSKRRSVRSSLCGS